MRIQDCLDNIARLESELYSLRRLDFESKGFQIGNVVGIEGKKELGLIVALNISCKEKSDEVFVNLLKKDGSLSKNIYSYHLGRLNKMYESYMDYTQATIN